MSTSSSNARKSTKYRILTQAELVSELQLKLLLYKNELKMILSNLKKCIPDPNILKRYKFTQNLLKFKNSEFIKIILLNQNFINLFYQYKLTKGDRFKSINDNISIFTKIIRIDVLHNILFNARYIDKLYHIIDEIKFMNVYLLYTNSKKNIPNYDEIIISQPDFFFDCVDDNNLIRSFGINMSYIGPVYINTDKITDSSVYELEERNHFHNGNSNFNYPNVIIDYNEQFRTSSDTALILDQYKDNILSESQFITLNRIFKVETNDSVYYIQILFNSSKQVYFIFIFEYFNTYSELLIKIPDINANVGRYITNMNCPVYVCMAYRDIQLETSRVNEKIFISDRRFFYKKYIYYGNYLTTSNLYRRQNILSLLFFIYGIILKHYETLYETNEHGMEFNEFFICKLHNATNFTHKQCPYCKLGYKIAKRGLNQPENININNLNTENLNIYTKLIENKDLYLLNNEYTLAEMNYKNPDQLEQIHSFYKHYLNPSTSKLDEIVYERVKETTEPHKITIAYQIMFETNFIHDLVEDCQNNPNKNYLNMPYITEMEEYTLEMKKELLRKYYMIYNII